MSEWVRFHRELTKGTKRTIPRAVRFVYMEISLEARAKRGYVVLSPELDEVSAIHTAIGGDKKEIAAAHKRYTSGAEPAWRFEIVGEERRLHVREWRTWNPIDGTGSERQKRFRDKHGGDHDDGDRNGPHNGQNNVETNDAVTESVTENPRVSARACATLLSSLSLDSSLPESSSSKTSAREREADSRPSVAPTPRLIDPKLTIDADSLEAAKSLGIVEAAVQWRRFVDKSIAKGELSTDFRALFRSRLAFIRNDERRERERDKRDAPFVRQNGPVDASDPYNAPETVRDRENARAAQFRRLAAEAVPAPTNLAALVSGVVGKVKPPASGVDVRQPLTDVEVEERRAKQLRAVAELAGDPPKSEGGTS